MLRLLALALLLLLPLAPVSAGEPPAREAGFVFPAMLGPMMRTGRTDHEARSRGLGFDYRYQSNRGAFANVYVYDKGLVLGRDAAGEVADELEATVREIGMAVEGGHYDDARFRTRSALSFGPARFAVARAVITRKGQAFDSYVYVAVRDGKFVKVRYSVPLRREKPAAADDFVARLMAAQGRGAARPGPPVVGPGTPERRAMRVRAAPAPLA